MEKQESGRVVWQSPANIALVKYWGKREGQIPMNPSLSLTLKNSTTTTAVSWRPRTSTDSNSRFAIDYLFEDKPRPSFMKKIEALFGHVCTDLPVLVDYHFTIQSSNTFPHSAGIASSASAMSALALCLCSFGERVMGREWKDFYQQASHFARLGSGSAARSVYGGVVVWGDRTGGDHPADNLIAAPFDNPHAIFHTFHDAILIVDAHEKAISSSHGHQLMNNHPYREQRITRATENVKTLEMALQTGDLEQFGAIVEAEALELHGLMMTSPTPYILMKPKSLAIIELIQQHRRVHKIPMYFTLDAGPNIHLLYPATAAAAVKDFIENHVVDYLSEGRWIADEVGAGPVEHRYGK